MINKAVQLIQHGEFQKAEEILLKITSTHPRDFDANHMLGVVFSELGKFDRAEKVFKLAYAIDSKYPPLFQNWGLFLSKTKRFREAVEKLNIAIKLAPNFAPVHSDRGNALKEMGRLEEAVTDHSRAISLAPQFFGFYINRGNTLREQQEYTAALADYDHAIELNPIYAIAFNGRGNVFCDLRRYDEAFAAYDKALALNPHLGEAWLGRGEVFLLLNHYEEALSAFDKALALKPDLGKACLGRGNVFFDLKRYEDALAAYDKALALEPDLAEACFGRGNLFYSLKRFEEAFAAYDKAFTLKPDLAEAEGARLSAKMHLCDWRDFRAECEHLISAVNDNKQNADSFAFLAIPSSPQDQIKCAKLWVTKKYPPSDKPIWRGEIYNHSRIRVAYLSADFRDHPVSYLMAGVFEQHDRNRFETIAISFGPDTPNDMLTRLKSAFDQFIDVKTRNDADVAKLLRELEVDIAVDLMGYTAHLRTGIFAHRPAPIQVNYLGYPGTMGANYIDYLIADPILIPESHYQNYLEKIVRLPNSYMPNDDSKRLIAEKSFDRAECGLPQTGLVFCCFNNVYKFNPDLFDSWARILKAVDGSVLWLSAANKIAIANLSNEISARGVNPNRLIFAPRLASSAEHLARHRLADLFLDTLPYNAHTTASDALLAGLPVITRIGETFAGRVAASLLTAIDLPELVTQTQDEYEKLAIELATDPAKLAHIKNRLAENRLTSPLFNTQLFTRHLERAYEAMHQRYMSGSPPDHIQTPNLVI